MLHLAATMHSASAEVFATKMAAEPRRTCMHTQIHALTHTSMHRDVHARPWSLP